MATNVENEARWIDAGNQLNDLIGNRRGVPCQLPDGTLVDVETCKGWLQDRIHEGQLVGVSAGWIHGKRGVVVSCQPDQ